ncbi:MAG TPA: hypothetical protein VFV38_30800 [Ktedonobacteraceae bacterium]|nr:hypothetical protein [Ktedonobacteraceae bacterium]
MMELSTVLPVESLEHPIQGFQLGGQALGVIHLSKPDVGERVVLTRGKRSVRRKQWDN